MSGKVISLYDFTGEAVRPWAADGYDCYCFDIQHSAVAPRRVYFEGGGTITFIHADLHDRNTLSEIVKEYADACFMMAFPVCTDLAVSGAKHFAAKLEADALYQIKALDHVRWCEHVGQALGCPYMIENPVSKVSTEYRPSDHRFHPWEFGGYIPANQSAHPVWPDYIAPRDAYPKLTCLWVGHGFIMPATNPVVCPPGWSNQQKKLGGKSQKTKNIRSATPRGFAIAVHAANAGQPRSERTQT